MNFWLNEIFSFTIVIGVLIGWIRFHKTDPAFLPFLILLTVGLIDETASLFIASSNTSNAFIFNLFTLVESFLVTLQFRKWNLFKGHKSRYYLVQVLFAAGWFAENFIHSFNAFNSWFIIGHSFLIVIMSIQMASEVIVNTTTPLYRQPIFLICLGLLISFSYTILIECYWLAGLNQVKLFQLEVYKILSYVNLLTNLLFSYAFLWVPLRLRYIMRHL